MKDLMTWVVIGVIFMGFAWFMSYIPYNTSTECEVPKTDSITMHDALLTTLFELRVQHPYIVYAQATLESGNFQSVVWQENNNLFGMRLAYQRPTTAIKANRGYAVYASWRDCVLDYAIWQSIYARNLTESEYYVKLKTLYAEDDRYVEKLKRIVPKISEL